MQVILSWLIVTFTVTNCLESNSAFIQEQSECIGHDQCPSSKACILGSCGDPCESLCGENSYCTTLQHIPACACKEGHTGNPFIACTLQVFLGGQPSIPSRKKMFQVIRTQQVEWIDALMFCLRNNSRLLSVDSMEEFEEIMKVIMPIGTGQTYWTSASDAGSEGSYTWVSSGKHFTSSSKMWRENEPNNRGGEEECVTITTLTTDNYGLNDAPCSTKYYFICEYFK